MIGLLSRTARSRPAVSGPLADSGGEITAAIGPSALTATPSLLKIGDGHATTFVVVGYPPEVGPGWLTPLLTLPLRLDVAVHIDPVTAPVAAEFLRKQRARLESSRRVDADRGKLADPAVDAVADDAAGMAERVARGARLFRVGVYLTIHATTDDELRDACAQILSTAAGMLLDLRPATWRQPQGWTSTLPLGVDALGMTRLFDADALAAMFPFAASDLPSPLPGDPPQTGGQLYGLTTTGTGIAWWDRWTADNHNAVVLARSGAGKSFLTKVEILRSLPQGIQVAVVDPDDEYADLAAEVGGVSIALGAPGVRFNPLDLPPNAARTANTLDRRVMFVQTLIDVMLAGRHDTGLSAAEYTILDQAIIACYATAGITADPATWDKPAPLLTDLADVLTGSRKPTWTAMADRLSPWTHGSHSAMFSGPTTTQPDSHLVAWSLRHLADELRPVGMLLALDAIDTLIDTPSPDGPLVRRLVVVDEAWLLMQDRAGARFLLKMAKTARKRGAGLTVVTQDAADLLSSDLGMAVVSNAATQILLQQSPQAIDIVADRFGLTKGEARALLTAGRGQALLVCGASRTMSTTIASATETRTAQTGLGLS